MLYTFWRNMQEFMSYVTLVLINFPSQININITCQKYFITIRFKFRNCVAHDRSELLITVCCFCICFWQFFSGSLPLSYFVYIKSNNLYSLLRFILQKSLNHHYANGVIQISYNPEKTRMIFWKASIQDYYQNKKPMIFLPFIILFSMVS